MAVWKRIGLDDNVPVTETVVITDSKRHRVKYYLKDYTDDMSRRPQFRCIKGMSDLSTNGLAADVVITIPYDTWFGEDKPADTIVGSNKYCEYTVYYIHRATGKVFVTNGLAQTLNHDKELSRKTGVLNRYYNSTKYKPFALCIPTEQRTWSTEKYSLTMVNSELKSKEPEVVEEPVSKPQSSGIVDLLKKWFKKE